MTDQLYGSQSDAEREQIARAMSERAAVLKRAEMLEWAYARQAAREAAARNAPQSQAPARRAAAPAPAPAQLTADGQTYIRQQLDKRDRAMTRAIATALVDEERQREALERRCAALETELAELRNRLDQERGQRGLRAVPSSPAALIA